MTNHPDISAADFARYVDANVVESHDLHGVRELLDMAGCTAPRLAWLAMALVLRSSRDGHTCVDLSFIDMWRGDIDPNDPGAPEWPTDPEEWMRALAGVPVLVGPPNAGDQPRRPFVIEGRRLYSARVHAQEVRVASKLAGEGGLTVRVVLGGPGSGKTTWVAKQLMDKLNAGEEPLVALAAPTGKAARRMVQVLESTLVRNNASESLIAAVRHSESMTVHKLLEYNPSRPKRVARDADRPLDRDLVIIDEASMLSLDSMSKLLDAMAPHSTLWLIGDPDQLASVEAGTVLADIASGKNISSAITPLTGQFRFDADSSIGKLVERVRVNDVEGALEVLRSGGEDLVWVDPMTDSDRLSLVQDLVVDHAKRTCALAASGDIEAAVGHNLELQVLSGTRRGPLGVTAWNSYIDSRLGELATGRWYHGRPVLVTQNDSATKLSNGDVGVVCAGPHDERVVAFGEPGTIRTFPPTRLPNTDDVHALTIHKSQGSEYDHAVVVLPDESSRVLTRELLYTGISRPKKRLTLVATEASIRKAIETPVRRATGLADRL